MTLAFDPAEVERRVLALAAHGAHSGTGVWRTVYDPAWLSARDLCRSWAEAAGLAVREDAVGNLWARLEGREGGPVIATGSHLDSQIPGGRYDGALGVIAALMALEGLAARHGRPQRTLEAVVFCEEEGSRFPSAGFWGSRAVTGRIAPGDLETTRAYDGQSIGDVMRGVGLDPDRVAEARRDDIDTFIELHIEQGPVLEAAGIPVAIVDAITGMDHREVVLAGAANHAGAFPMDLRRDPMAGFAEIAGRVIDHAHRLGRPAVTTVGRVAVEPNFPAIQPGSVTFTIDARHPDPAAHRRMLDTHAALIAETADRRGLDTTTTSLFHHPPALSDPSVLEALSSAADAEGIATLTMSSGAGHDTQRMASIARTAMIFVRSAGGRSHTPEEFSTPEDCAQGIRLLAATLHRLAYRDAATA